MTNLPVCHWPAPQPTRPDQLLSISPRVYRSSPVPEIDRHASRNISNCAILRNAVLPLRGAGVLVPWPQPWLASFSLVFGASVSCEGPAAGPVPPPPAFGQECQLLPSLEVGVIRRSAASVAVQFAVRDSQEDSGLVRVQNRRVVSVHAVVTLVLNHFFELEKHTVHQVA